ncbi:MAG: signal peptidase II [Alphaproteobacteria bacterium]|nr:MAG: signal peptidase II [Alphaproteobacteria bacterium]
MRRIFEHSGAASAKGRRLGWAVALLVLLADQASKWWVLEMLRLEEGESIVLLPVFNLTFVWNQGISLGLLQQETALGRLVLIALTGLVTIYLVVWLMRSGRRLTAIALGLIIGGALGNLVDRIRFGAVADFLHFHAFGHSFYIFNLADAAISVGVAVLILDAVLGPTPPARPE